MQQDEKKVEYIELIYDLIFVYLIGRNNSLLQQVENGFISGRVFLTYVLATLSIIQIWNFTTFYINRYGKNSLRNHVFLFINMYLLYFMADGTRVYWESHFNRYNVAWALILLNIAVQYFIEGRDQKSAPWILAQIRYTGLLVLSEAVLVLISIPVYHLTGFILAPFSIALGIVGTILLQKINILVPVDFPHLSERAMLYVVFTFGEMIIAIAGYFKEEVSPNMILFSLMAFLIVAGLFLSYGTMYDHILDREASTTGVIYMVIHIFMIFALNNITTALEFMREEEIALLPKIMFITGSILLFYVFLFATGAYARERLRPGVKFYVKYIVMAGGFALLMFLFRSNMIVNIIITVLYVYLIFLMLHMYGRIIKE